jgi:outer membrane receptor protein involved in Fe transport
MKRTSSSAAALAILLSLVFLLSGAPAARAAAGPDGSVTGTVTDAGGTPVEGAALTLVNGQLAVYGSATSGNDGRFTFSGVPAGRYAVVAVKNGVAEGRVAVDVSSDGAAEARVTLDVAPFSEQVTVTAEQGQVRDRDTVAQQVNVVTRDEMMERVQTTLNEVAEEEPGVSVQRTSPVMGGIYVRGLTGKNVAVYVDGVRYTTAAQRGGVSTFFNLNEPSALASVEILRGPNSSQYSSDSLGGTVHLLSKVPAFGADDDEWHANIDTFYSSPANAFGSNATVSYGSKRVGVLMNIAGRRVNTLRTADGLDTHAAVTRFLGIPSDVFGNDRLPDTAFTQYSGTIHTNFAIAPEQQLIVHYQRSQQDGGKRYDQLLGGDGNLVAELRNLMLDFGYLRYDAQSAGFFDRVSATFSFNSQREERVNQGGNGNPLSSITSQYERTNVYGFSGYVAKQLAEQNTLLVGADFYHERVNTPAYTFSPSTGTVTPSRPRIPDEARYDAFGVYVQDSADLLDDKVHLSGALRYGRADYESRASNSPIVLNMPLFPNDDLDVDDVSGRFGVVVRPWEEIGFHFTYSRGFRAPDITELGTLGLTGDGFEVAFADLAGRGATLGTTVGNQVVDSGRPLAQLESEVSNNYEVGFNVDLARVRFSATGYLIDLEDTLTKQPLILPQGAVGQLLGSEPIVAQSANGTVFVAASSSPVLARANFVDARLTGLETELEAKLTENVTFAANFTMMRAEDRANGAPPNIEGGTPPATGHLRLRYAPSSSRWWVEAYSTLADRQNRLSALDLSDRRTGGRRTGGSIAAFFGNGARVRGLIGSGPDATFGTSDDLLLATGETLFEVQRRLLGTAPEGFLFRELPGYGLIGVRGGVRIDDRSDVFIDASNLADKSYRGPSWGVDGPGAGVTVHYRIRF